MEAFKQQQARWAKGGAQTCKKLLPTILRSNLPLRIKMEAFFHLTSCTVYVYIVLMTLLLYPVVYLKVHLLSEGWARYLFDISILLVATCSASTFYVCSQRALFRTWSESLKYLPFLMALLQGFFGQPGEFVRTPKFGEAASSTRWKLDVEAARRRNKKLNLQPFFELGMGVYLMACLMLCLTDYRVTLGVPFLCLFMIGYLYVPLTTWFGHRLGRIASEENAQAELEPVPVRESE
jgi:hypothetical protein